MSIVFYSRIWYNKKNYKFFKFFIDILAFIDIFIIDELFIYTASVSQKTQHRYDTSNETLYALSWLKDDPDLQ